MSERVDLPRKRLGIEPKANVPSDKPEPGPEGEHRLRLDWARLDNMAQPASAGQISQSLVGGREKTVTVEVRRRRPRI